MSREQGPHAMGMRPAAIAAGRRQCLGSNCCNGSEAAQMSLGAGAPRSGDATRASAAGRRWRGLCIALYARRRRK